MLFEKDLEGFTSVRNGLKFSDNYFGITYGVNVGENDLVIASLANIIALRMMQSKKVWL